MRNIRAPEAYRREVRNLLEKGTEVTVSQRLSVIAEDPEDDKFLECALEAGADYLVSSDDHLLRLGSFEGTRILKPSEFIKALRRAR